MEYILTSNQHEVKNNCLRYYFQKPIRFENQYISLISMIFYNYFENITDKFKLTIKNKIQSYTINFKNGSYYVSDISKIIEDEIKNNFNNLSENEKYIEIVVDVNRYAILIVIKKDWTLELDKNFMNLFGFEKNIFQEGYHRSTKVPKLDKTKFLKIYCNLVDNKEDSRFLTNVFIKNNIGEQITYENHNNYKRKNILNTTFNYIEVCIKNENNEDIIMKDFFQINLYIGQIYMTNLDKLFEEILIQLQNESIKYKKLKICKYSFEISKVAILSLATGLSFINIFAILSIILIPVIDTTKHTANVDQRLSMCKLKKDLLKELYNYKSTTYKNLNEEEIDHLYTKLTNKLSVINTF